MGSRSAFSSAAATLRRRAAALVSLAHAPPVRAVLPPLAQAPDAGLDPLALRVALFVRADHHQQAVDQIHGFSLSRVRL